MPDGETFDLRLPSSELSKLRGVLAILRSLAPGGVTFKQVAALVFTFMFSLFILEEGIQKMMFATFPLSDIGAYQKAANVAGVMGGVAKAANILNNIFGWIFPPSWYAYHIYFAVATPIYVDAMRTQAAHYAGTNQVPIYTEPGTAAQPQLPQQATIVPSPVETQMPVETTVYALDPSRFYPIEPILEEWPDALQVSDIGLSYLNSWETVIVPVSHIDDPSPQVRLAEVLGTNDFNLVCFPGDEEVYRYFPRLQRRWVVVQGVIKFFEKWQTFEIIVSDWDSQILATYLLQPE